MVAMFLAFNPPPMEEVNPTQLLHLEHEFFQDKSFYFFGDHLDCLADAEHSLIHIPLAMHGLFRELFDAPVPQVFQNQLLYRLV